jgi:hypothetical protein
VNDNLVSFTPPEGSDLIAVDLREIDAADQPVPDLAGLLYREAVHSLSGEPGIGKTLVAQAFIALELKRGGRALILDYEDSARTTRTRLADLGVDDEGLGRVTYLRPFGPLSDADLAWLPRLVEGQGIGLVLIDSVPEALATENLDENASTDVSRWYQRLPRPLARAGASVLVIDHVTKSTEQRGRWARGSGAKLAAIDGAAYTIETSEPFSRERSGSVTLRVAKDRHGAIGGNGEPVRTIRFSVAGGSLYQVVFLPFEAPTETEPHLRALDAVSIAAALRASGGVWPSFAAAVHSLGVPEGRAREVINAAVRAGQLIERVGTHGERIFEVHPSAWGPEEER